MRRTICLAAGAAALLVSTPPPVLATQPAARARMVDTRRCTPRGDYCIVLRYDTSSRRVLLIIAHKVSGRAGHQHRCVWPLSCTSRPAEQRNGTT
ncbi:hypothetical protein ACFU8W_36135 [Streptomyces sp. NPDC057565]|uniref:hypothetical protein n=1 Tax=Streptomyces sp. NPDC057565 TaxID=3346169 RepID=UPI0036BD9A50